MPKVSDYYGGVYLTGADLGGKTHRLQVGRVDVEEIGDEREKKLVVSFANAKKSLILNKTNASTLVSTWSDETDGWADRWLEVFTVPVTFNGRTYDGIRVRPIQETPALTPTLTPPANGSGVAGVVGVPAAQTRAAMQAGVDSPGDIPF